MPASTYIAIPASLKTTAEVNAYSDEANARKQAFHKDGKAFLTKLARALGLATGSFTVRSNQGGIAVSGEVTLHSNDIYIQIGASFSSHALQVMYRTCNDRKDCCGHTNNFASMHAFVGAENQDKMVHQLLALIAREQQRKAKLLVSA